MIDPWTYCPKITVQQRDRTTTGMRYSYELREVGSFLMVVVFMGVMAFVAVAAGG